MNKIIGKLHNRKGMTLIEVIVAFAMVAVISVVIIIGFRTMGTVLNEGGKINRIDQQLEKEIATSSSSAIDSQEATLDVSGEAISIKGEIKEYYSIDDDGSRQSFRVFEAEK